MAKKPGERYDSPRDLLQDLRGLQIDGMDEDTRKHYLVESIFLNTVTYENERLSAYMKKLAAQSAAVDSDDSEQS